MRRLACLMAAALLPSCAPKGPPALATQAPRPAPPAPVPPEALEASIARGRAFLLQHQNRDGSWGSAGRTKDLNIMAPAPGGHQSYRAAVTALCVSALIEASDGSEASRAAVARGEAWLLENLPALKRPTPDVLYNVWAHAYAIDALLKLRALPSPDPAREEKLSGLIRRQIAQLGTYESVDGGWGYYDFRGGTRKPASDSTSFITATALIALLHARAAGYEVPQKLIDRAADSIRRQRKPDCSYLYGEYFRWHPMAKINRPGGSLGRSQACNAALRLAGDPLITDAVLEAWLDRLVVRNGWLDIGRKRPVPHESWFQVAGYFFYYGHYYASYCIQMLPEKERPRYQDHLATILMPLQEKDGSWWDYPLYDYGQAYGTAFALMSLARYRRAD